MRNLRHFCTILGIFFVLYYTPATAQSTVGGTGIYFEETFFPEFVDKFDPTLIDAANPNGPNDTGLGFNTNTTLGYAIVNTWLIGFTYSYKSISTERSASGTIEGLKTDLTETKLGATVGWLGTNARLLATFFLSGNKKYHEKYFDSTGAITTDRTYTNKKISGFQLTAGYSFNVFSSFSIGPSLVYTIANYAKQTMVNSVAPPYSNLATKAGGSELKPMISMLFRW